MSGDPPAAAMSVFPLHDAFTRTVGPQDKVALKIYKNLRIHIRNKIHKRNKKPIAFRRAQPANSKADSVF